MTKCEQCGTELAANRSGFCPDCAGQTRTFAAVATPVAQSVQRSLSNPVAQSAPRPVSQASVTRFLPGDVLVGRYRIVALLGRGGMGEVYRADDLSLDQPVALKFLASAATRDQSAVTRFRNEVRIARQVSHPNVCRVYDLAEVEGDYFLSMEYVDGEDLGSLLRRIGRLPEDKALDISRRLCAGLAAAHERGVLHRDLKPGNVMLDGRGQVLLTDFGLAGIAGEIAGNEVRNGTPAYMAPEQLEGREVSVRSDIYSLGLVLHEVFTGHKPEASKAPSTFVRDLDPAIERVILRCLERDPNARPISALAVSAALPGGDPLAAALAAGETPSPEMVASAGEGFRLHTAVAAAWLAGILIALIGLIVYTERLSFLTRIETPYSPEVLRQKARDLIRELGYTNRGVDSANGFQWDFDQIQYAKDHEKPAPDWDKLARSPVPLLRFWYRQADSPIIGQDLKDDKLTPGIVTYRDPPFTESGMISLLLGPDARLIRFEAMPEQKRKSTLVVAEVAAAPQWDKLFTAAHLEATRFHQVASEWTFLAASDVRKAWEGTAKTSTRPLRIEAAAWEGRPTAWEVMGPWNKAERLPENSSLWNSGESLWFIILFTLAALTWAPMLARRNLLRGNGDRQGAFRVAVFMFCVQLALWVLRAHFTSSPGTPGMGYIAVATSIFYAAFIWAIYLAFEPQVRRRWPQSLISWSAVLAGKWRDPVVGRDTLYGIAMAISWLWIGTGVHAAFGALNTQPDIGNLHLLLGARETLGSWLLHVPGAIREALLLFLLIFGFRTLLKREWLASGLFVLLFTLGTLQSGSSAADVITQMLIYTMIVLVVFRVGVLSLAIGLLMVGVLDSVPVTFDTGNWYFGNAAFMYATAAALAIAAFRIAIKPAPNSAILR